MLRTALTPRFLGLLGLVLVVGAVFVQLGRWQLGVAESTAHREAVERARAESPAPLPSLLEPHAPFRDDLSSRPVTTTGQYAADGQLLVPDRRLDGVAGLWVLTPFIVDGSGATLPVVRGFVTDPSDAGPRPRGPSPSRVGWLGESPTRDPVPDGQIGSVDLSVLVNTWPGELYNASLPRVRGPRHRRAADEGADPARRDGRAVAAAAYAVQWWVFAAFALWLWVRWRGGEAQRVQMGNPEELAATPGDNGRRDDA